MTVAAVVAGLGIALPDRIVTNDELAARLDTSDEWISSRTGIRQRHVSGPDESTSDLAVAATVRALESAAGLGVTASDIGVVVLATTTPDRPCPATAPDVAARVGLDEVAAFDVSAVCSGFVYALAAASGLITAGVCDAAAVIGADTYSTILDPDDRGTAVIFGDGAGAVLLRRGDADEPGALGPFDLGSDGRHHEDITIRGGGSRQRTSGKPAEPGDEYFQMNGSAVFAHAVRRMSGSVRKVLAEADWTSDHVDRLVAHQANSRILDAVAGELGLPASAVVSNLGRVGNTSAASIPLALADAVADGSLRAGHRVLLAAFGGGFTWGSTALRWPAGIDLSTLFRRSIHGH
ncbi:ketoacyl-ACP synthase III [Actinocorallia lasiicapitis]